jgi:hypothetical protein
MNISAFTKQYASQIDGQFTEYDNSKSIIVVPLADGRFQTVILTTENSKRSGKHRAVLSSKVCEYTPAIDLKMLLEKSSGFDYSKFVLDEGYIKVEASCPTDGAIEDEVKHMIQEVAIQADAYELKLTGKDIN